MIVVKFPRGSSCQLFRSPYNRFCSSLKAPTRGGFLMVRMLVKLYKWEARGAICTLSPRRFFSFVSIISLHWKSSGLLVLKLTERIILVALSM